MTNQESGERIVIINDSSPDYSLIRITKSDLEVHGKINPHFSKDILLPNYSLPTKIRVVCQEPFGREYSFQWGGSRHSESLGFS